MDECIVLYFSEKFYVAIHPLNPHAKVFPSTMLEYLIGFVMQVTINFRSCLCRLTSYDNKQKS